MIELEAKVAQLADDLASQDAQAFLAHSQFLHDKFGHTGVLPAPGDKAGTLEKSSHHGNP